MTTNTKAYGANANNLPLEALTIERRSVLEEDIKIDILFCGVCHSDIHTARGEWPGTVYPVVPGHEIIGKVSEVGKSVTNFKIGDVVGVGCMVDSCQECSSCNQGIEQYCENGEVVFTYNSPDKHLSGKTTYGGYSKSVVVDEKFVLKIPEGLDLASAAPLLCAGITTYSPLKHWNVGAGKKVGIVGLGGLGHMGLKFSHAFGAKTVLFTTSANKVEDGLRLGADEVVISTDEASLRQHRNSFDFILDTVAASHDLDKYTTLLRHDGALCLVGIPELSHPSPSVRPLIGKRASITGSAIGGTKETQEMLNLCAKHNITCDVELIKMNEINQAYGRMVKNDVKYRFVIDMASL